MIFQHIITEFMKDRGANQIRFGIHELTLDNLDFEDLGLGFGRKKSGK